MCGIRNSSCQALSSVLKAERRVPRPVNVLWGRTNRWCRVALTHFSLLFIDFFILVKMHFCTYLHFPTASTDVLTTTSICKLQGSLFTYVLLIASIGSGYLVMDDTWSPIKRYLEGPCSLLWLSFLSWTCQMVLFLFCTGYQPVRWFIYEYL